MTPLEPGNPTWLEAVLRLSHPKTHVPTLTLEGVGAWALLWTLGAPEHGLPAGTFSLRNRGQVGRGGAADHMQWVVV